MKNYGFKVRTDGYIYASDLCKMGGRLWGSYNENKQTKKFLDILSSDIKIPTDVLVQSNKTGKNDTRGTWIHPKVAIHLAQWISPEFSVKVSNWISEWSETSNHNQNKLFHEMSNLKPLSTSNQTEKQIQEQLKITLDAKEEVSCEAGRIDLMNEEYVIEIKEVSNWKHAIGQVMVYGSYYPSKQKKLYLFGKTDNKTMITDKCSEFNIQVEFIEAE